MYRLLAAAFVLALGLAVAHAADSQKDKKEAREQTPGEMFGELKEKFEAAKDKQARDGLLATYSAKFLAYAEKNKDEKRIEALFFVLQIPGKDDKGSPRAQALAILNKDFAKSAKMGKLLKKLHGGPDNAAVRALLLDIAEHNKDKTTRAYAYRGLIRQSEQAAGWAESVKEDAEVKEKMEKARGKEAVNRVLALAASSDQDIKAYKAKLDGELKGVFPDLTVGKAAPEINTEDVAGKKVKLSGLEGKVVVLDFWATWCGPCKGMIPHTRELVKKMDGKPFVFVSISADAKKDTLTEFLEKTKMPWTHWYSGTEGVVEDWEIEAFPTIYILDAKGVIRKKIVGASDPEAIDKEVVKLVREAEDAKKGKTK
jgi:thiol-disulfide isomerase/thioredoxin